MKQPIAISLNFDSLNEAFGFQKGFQDPSFFKVMDRFLAFSERYDFKYSIYVIGKDLENPEYYARVKEWAAAGHEIGNHTWSHPVNLGAMSTSMTRDQILKAHDLISQCAGTEPRGFIAPAWSVSRRVMSTLIELNYLYDTSVFPSVLLYPMVFKMMANHSNSMKGMMMRARRADWFVPWTKPKQPFYCNRRFKVCSADEKEKILALPLPTTKWSCLAYWHTIGFMFGWEHAHKQLREFLEKDQFFYYLIHPGDLIGKEDIENLSEGHHGLERMGVSLEDKQKAVEEVFKIMKSSGREIMTMQELANFYSGSLVS